MKAIAVVIPSLCTTTVTDLFMLVAPRSQAVIAAVCLGLHARTRSAGGVEQRGERDRWHGFPQPHHDVSTTLEPPDDRWRLRCARAPSARALEPSAPSAPPRELASTYPHQKHVLPDIKHNRIPALGISFEQPKLPTLIEDIMREILPPSPHP